MSNDEGKVLNGDDYVVTRGNDESVDRIRLPALLLKAVSSGTRDRLLRAVLTEPPSRTPKEPRCRQP